MEWMDGASKLGGWRQGSRELQDEEDEKAAETLACAKEGMEGGPAPTSHVACPEHHNIAFLSPPHLRLYKWTPCPLASWVPLRCCHGLACA